MDTRKEIEGLLKSLKNKGIDRDQIEKDLNYSKNYIDQTLSKGGNRRFFNALKGYAESKLQKATKQYQDEKKESIVKEPDGAYIKDGSIILIELKTASGKAIQVKPEGESEIALLNAFLEERDRVLEERNRIIEKIEKSKDELFQILNSALSQIHADTHTALAYQKAWVRYEAERASAGDKQKENEIRYRMSTLVDDELEGDEVSDSHAGIGNPDMEGQ